MQIEQQLLLNEIGMGDHHKFLFYCTLLRWMSFDFNYHFFRDGDMYAALKDCQIAVKLDPEHNKAYLRLFLFLFPEAVAAILVCSIFVL